jgi:hypothetical protein
VVSVVSAEPLPESPDYRSAFFYGDITTARLNTISGLLAQSKLQISVGKVLPLEQYAKHT